MPNVILDAVATDTGCMQRLQHREQHDRGHRGEFPYMGRVVTKALEHSVAVSLLQLQPDVVNPGDGMLQLWCLLCNLQLLQATHPTPI